MSWQISIDSGGKKGKKAGSTLTRLEGGTCKALWHGSDGAGKVAILLAGLAGMAWDGSGRRHGEAGLPSSLSPSPLSSKIPVPVKMTSLKEVDGNSSKASQRATHSTICAQCCDTFPGGRPEQKNIERIPATSPLHMEPGG